MDQSHTRVRGAVGREQTQNRGRSTQKKAKTRKRTTKQTSFLRRLLYSAFSILWSYLLRLLYSIISILWSIGWRAGIVFVVILASSTGFYYVKLLPTSELLEARSRGSAVLLDKSDEPFAWRGSQFGGKILSKDVSPFLKNAIIAAEDKRFYGHLGVSPRGILGAILINLREGRGPFQGHGGSTITQQVAKLLCLGRKYNPDSGLSEAQFERDCRKTTLWRKIKEIPYAFAMELKYSKNEILTIYLNRVYLGAGATGFEAASQRYFGVSIREVTPAQSAMLAGLLTAPSVYAPTRNMAKAVSRANLIVDLMEEEGYLSVSEARDARANHARLTKGGSAKAGSYFADWLMETVPDFLKSNTIEDVVMRTTLDLRIQNAADEAMVHVFKTKVKPDSRAEAAIVVMSADGAVRAMTGGRNPRSVGQFNRATQAIRQTGSVFKPFVFAAALETGIRPNDQVLDEEVSYRILGSKTWRPKNYKDKYEGPITLTRALAKSSNVAAARLSEEIGRDQVQNLAKKFGIKNKLASGPALALGASESTLLEMTGAYAGFLNRGNRTIPYGLIDLRLKEDSSPLFKGLEGLQERAVSERTALQMVEMLRQVVETGTGQRAKISDRQLAGKTGTTQGARDAWFIGFSADYVAGVWMGYDDNTPLTGVTGGGLPAEIWRETMERIHEGLPSKLLPGQGQRINFGLIELP